MRIEDQGGAPDSGTLPTADRPIRLAAFDELFAAALRRPEGTSPTALRWWLAADAEAAGTHP